MKFIRTGLLWLLFTATAHATVILQYHHISNETPASTSLAPELFAEHMAFIEELGYDVIKLSDLIDAIRRGQPLPENSVVITFDDGYTDNLVAVSEELHTRGWPYTVFVPPQLIDQRAGGYLSWDELRMMAENGAEIANHSMAHEHLAAKLSGESDDEWRVRVRENILAAERRIQEETGQRHQTLAYPYGEFSPQLTRLLDELEFAGLGQHSGAVDRFSNLQALPRFPFGGAYGGMSGFRTKVQTIAMPVASFELKNGNQTLSSHILNHDQSWPTLILNLGSDSNVAPSSINCFASGLGAVEVEVTGESQVSTSPEGFLSLGRSRYNCTAPSSERGRFFWYSVPIIRLDEGNQWPPED